jgi:branched-subunit amino acid aminotransferase/4-amino-4-deoxychorismate lyase
MRLIEETCSKANIKFSYTNITTGDLESCDDMFLTTTVGNLVTVTEFENKIMIQSAIQKKILGELP